MPHYVYLIPTRTVFLALIYVCDRFLSLCCSKYPPIAGLLIINLNKIFAAKFKSFNNCKDYEKALTICLLVLGFAGGVLAQPRSINGVIKTMLKELSVNRLWGRFNKASNGNKLMRMNYDIHTGTILDYLVRLSPLQ